MWHYLRPDGSVIRAWRLGCSITGRASTMSFELLLHSWVQGSILHGIWQHIKVSSLIQTWRSSAFILGRVSVIVWSRVSTLFTTCRKYRFTFTMAFANGLRLHKKKQMHHCGSKNHRKPSNTHSDDLDWKQRILLVSVPLEQIIWPKKTLNHSVIDFLDSFLFFCLISNRIYIKGNNTKRNINKPTQRTSIKALYPIPLKTKIKQ